MSIDEVLGRLRHSRHVRRKIFCPAGRAGADVCDTELLARVIELIEQARDAGAFTDGHVPPPSCTGGGG